MITVIVAYDICSITKEDKKRLRQVAETCENYGYRMQKSIFRCELKKKSWQQMRSRLLNIIDESQDSLVFMHQNRFGRNSIEQFGINSGSVCARLFDF